jgi:hypothetical protein
MCLTPGLSPYRDNRTLSAWRTSAPVLAASSGKLQRQLPSEYHVSGFKDRDCVLTAGRTTVISRASDWSHIGELWTSLPQPDSTQCLKRATSCLLDKTVSVSPDGLPLKTALSEGSSFIGRALVKHTWVQSPALERDPVSKRQMLKRAEMLILPIVLNRN